jgi:hypothetical protein
MMPISDIPQTDLDSIPIDPFWNLGDDKELKMHRIHAYPAKFPAFITSKAIEFAKQSGLKVSCIADIFCGCGTVAFEARRSNIDFWGCDINPVATMIAKVKSHKFQTKRLQNYFESIVEQFEHYSFSSTYDEANERLKYWYDKKHYDSLYKLKVAIESSTPKKSIYRLFFLCAFSNILKPTSCWLAKSIKPTVSKNKVPAEVSRVFKLQCSFMIKANSENSKKSHSRVKILTGNILSSSTKKPWVDMIVTSPPYVTSYEYADIHQLSTLWLNIAQDFRAMRKGTIGSSHQKFDLEKELNSLNKTGHEIVVKLQDAHEVSRARSVAKYFVDMEKTAKICYDMLKSDGLALFVIGNTEYKGVRIDNAHHFAESLKQHGFTRISVTKRKISNKILTPFRDSEGHFTSDKQGRKIYSEEFILIALK